MPSAPSSLSELLGLGQLTDASRWYLRHPDHFALGDPEGRYPAVLGPRVLHRAAKQPVVTFGEKPLRFLEDFCDVQVSDLIARAGRGCGKTFMSALGQAVLAWCLPTFTCTVSAGSFEQAFLNYRYWIAFSEEPSMHAPTGPLLADPMQKGDTKFRNGGWLRVLTASEKQAKGEHPMMVVVDEACSAEPRILDLIEGQLTGGPPPYGAEVALYRIMSTGDKLNHSFRDKWDARKELRFVSHTWGMRDAPWNTETSILRLESRHSENWCDIHIRGLFGSSTGAVFDRPQVLGAAIVSLEEDPTGLWSYATRHPDTIKAQTLGVDWGFDHPTVMVVSAEVDLEPGRRVAFPDVPGWPMVYTTAIEGYSGRDITWLWDRITNMADAHRAPAFMDANLKFENERMKMLLRQVGLRGKAVSGSYKGGMIDIANSLLEKGRMRIPQTIGRLPGEDKDEGQKLLDQMLRYSWMEGPVEKPRKENDDYVDAWLLSLWGLYGGKRLSGRSRIRVNPR